MLTLPVQLQIVDATAEMVFSPNPIIAHNLSLYAGGFRYS